MEYYNPEFESYHVTDETPCDDEYIGGKDGWYYT